MNVQVPPVTSIPPLVAPNELLILPTVPPTVPLRNTNAPFVFEKFRVPIPTAVFALTTVLSFWEGVNVVISNV